MAVSTKQTAREKSVERSDIEELISRRLCNIETAIPGIVTNVAKNGTLSVVPLIKRVTVDGIVDVDNLAIEGIKKFVFGNGNVAIDVEVDVGSQVMLVAMSRSARVWLNSQSEDAVIPRSYSGNTLNDLVAVPICRCDREYGKKNLVTLKDNGVVSVESEFGQKIVLTESGDIELSLKSGKAVKVNGNLSVSGDVSADGDVKAGIVSLMTHTHVVPGVTLGEGATNTNPPT